MERSDFTISSQAFDHGSQVPKRYTCDGENLSPPINWAGLPSGAESLVLICEDPDAPRGIFTHWLLYDIPTQIQQFAEGFASSKTIASGGVPGRNNFGHLKYDGPCPPPGPAHRYFFRLYAVDLKLNLPPGAIREQVLRRTEGHILAKAELMGTYARR